MKISLSRVTQEPIELIYKAYRLCYSKGSQDEIKLPYVQGVKEPVAHLDYEKMMNFIKPLMADGHTTPLEHVSLTFDISGVSRALTHQLVRHRTGKFNQQSQRYVRLEQFEYVVPPEIAKIPHAKLLFVAEMQHDQFVYDTLVEMLLVNYITQYIVKHSIVIEKDNSSNDFLIEYFSTNYKKEYNSFVKKAIEDARYVFPNACASNITVTFDANNFRKFIGLRACVNAQWEVRELANTMLKLAKAHLPFIDYQVMNCGRTCFECGKK